MTTKRKPKRTSAAKRPTKPTRGRPRKADADRRARHAAVRFSETEIALVRQHVAHRSVAEHARHAALAIGPALADLRQARGALVEGETVDALSRLDRAISLLTGD